MNLLRRRQMLVLVRTFAVGSVKVLVRLLVAVKEREHHDVLPHVHQIWIFNLDLPSKFGGSHFRMSRRNAKSLNMAMNRIIRLQYLAVCPLRPSRADSFCVLIRRSKGDFEIENITRFLPCKEITYCTLFHHGAHHAYSYSLYAVSTT